VVKILPKYLKFPTPGGIPLARNPWSKSGSISRLNVKVQGQEEFTGEKKHFQQWSMHAREMRRTLHSWLKSRSELEILQTWIKQEAKLVVKPQVGAFLVSERNNSSAAAEMGDNRYVPKIGGRTPFGGDLGPHLTQCHLGQGLPPYQVASWCI